MHDIKLLVPGIETLNCSVLGIATLNCLILSMIDKLLRPSHDGKLAGLERQP